MDGNKDDAVKAVEIAKAALKSGDKSKALKFLTKARRLDPSLSLDHLLSLATSSPSTSSEPAPEAKPFDPLRRRSVGATSSDATSSAGASAATEEQMRVVREVIRKRKDFYEVLGLEKSCSVEDIRKAYRKLSLKVHPDKNPAPGAEEAFKSVSKAFQCLSNEENRRREQHALVLNVNEKYLVTLQGKYDVSGSDEPAHERRVNRHNGQGFNGFYGEEIDPDEIFRNFFYGGMNPGVATQFGSFSFGPGVGVRVGGNNGGMARTCIQLLPILLILLVNFLPSNEPAFVLSRQYPYEYRFTTGKDVNYYVKSSRFEQEYPQNSVERGRLEQQVEREYVSILSHNCRMERQRMHWGYVRETPYCDSLEKFQAMA